MKELLIVLFFSSFHFNLLPFILFHYISCSEKFTCPRFVASFLFHHYDPSFLSSFLLDILLPSSHFLTITTYLLSAPLTSRASFLISFLLRFHLLCLLSFFHRFFLPSHYLIRLFLSCLVLSFSLISHFPFTSFSFLRIHFFLTYLFSCFQSSFIPFFFYFFAFSLIFFLSSFPFLFSFLFSFFLSFSIISTELGRLPRVKTCANLMRKICYNNKDRMQAGLICGGWDPYEGGQVYEIPLGTNRTYVTARKIL